MLWLIIIPYTWDDSKNICSIWNYNFSKNYHDYDVGVGSINVNISSMLKLTFKLHKNKVRKSAKNL